MKFNHVYVCRPERFAVGIEEETGKYYVSFPVSNPYVDYSEYYEITRAQFDLFQTDLQAALIFVTACRQHEKDELLIVKPGRLRGVPS